VLGDQRRAGPRQGLRERPPLARRSDLALELLLRARRAKALLESGEGEVGAVAELASALEAAPPETRAAGLRLFGALRELLAPR
jgi:hypothetical protein